MSMLKSTTYYFQINKWIAERGSMPAVVILTKTPNQVRSYIELMQMSDFAWEDTNKGLRRIKDRTTGAVGCIEDDKRAFWIKMKATRQNAR